MNFSQGHSGTKVRNVNRACFPKEKTPEFTKMGEIHELFVLALSLVWFAGASPDKEKKIRAHASKVLSGKAPTLPSGLTYMTWPKVGQQTQIMSRPGKPNQKKGQNEKFMNFAYLYEFWCLSLGKQARFTFRTFVPECPCEKFMN